MPQQQPGAGSPPRVQIGHSNMPGLAKAAPFDWKWYAPLLSGVIGILVTLLTQAKEEMRPASYIALLIAAALVSLAVIFVGFFPVFRGWWQRYRATVAARSAEKEAGIRRERLAVLVNQALELFHRELRWKGAQSSLGGAASALTDNLSCAVAASRRRVLEEVTYCLQGLPTKVDAALADMAGRLLDRAAHRFIELLPEYLDTCEKAADALPAQDCAYFRKRANQFREHANDFIRTYREIARQAEQLLPGASPLNAFSPGALLPPPVIRAVGQ